MNIRSIIDGISTRNTLPNGNQRFFSIKNTSLHHLPDTNSKRVFVLLYHWVKRTRLQVQGRIRHDRSNLFAQWDGRPISLFYYVFRSLKISCVDRLELVDLNVGG